MKEEIIRISKEDIKVLGKAKIMMLSSDIEVKQLGYRLFTNSCFYKQCKSKSLYYNRISLYSSVIKLKSHILKNPIYVEYKVKELYKNYILPNKLLKRRVNVKFPKEKETFKEILQLLQSDNKESVEEAIELFTKSEIGKNDNIFYYDHGFKISVNDVLKDLGYYRTYFKFLNEDYIDFIYGIINESPFIYEESPVTIVLEE